jgi:mannose-1-phosphate guanylyltransferase
MRLFDGASLLQLARQRLAGLFEPENTWIITSADYLDLVAGELPDLPRANLIGEPMGRDTANAVGLAAHLLSRRDPDATMAVFTADHLISPQDAFAAAIRTGLDVAEQNPEALVTFGITPTEPHTGYGYVRRGTQLAPETFQVCEFKEKPALDVARRYLNSGDYYWNSGMFAWRTSAILAELRRSLPKNDATLATLADDWDTLAGTPEGAALFESLHRISVDYGVMEQAERVLLVEMACRWLDLGSWMAIADTRDPDSDQNIRIAPNTLTLKSQGNVFVSEDDHLIVALGVDDLVVVHSPDATLICHRDHVQAIKDLVEIRKDRFGDRYE